MTLTCRMRVDLPCEWLAFTTPPHRVDVLILKGAGPVAMVIYSPMGRLLEIQRWLAKLGPTRTHSGGGLDPHVLRAEFAESPSPWGPLLDGVTTRSLHLSTAGIATLFLEPGEDPDTVVREAHVRDAEAQVSEARTRPPVKGLTDRQIDALSLAVSLGYYEVPHRVTQRELAQRLDMSLSGLSRLLRRAEASVIAIHMDALVDAGADEERFRSLMGVEEGMKEREALHVRVR